MQLLLDNILKKESLENWVIKVNLTFPLIFLQEYNKMASSKKETFSPQNEGVLSDNNSSVANRNNLSGHSCGQNTEQELLQTSTTVVDVYSKGRLLRT